MAESFGGGGGGGAHNAGAWIQDSRWSKVGKRHQHTAALTATAETPTPVLGFGTTSIPQGCLYAYHG